MEGIDFGGIVGLFTWEASCLGRGAAIASDNGSLIEHQISRDRCLRQGDYRTVFIIWGGIPWWGEVFNCLSERRPVFRVCSSEVSSQRRGSNTKAFCGDLPTYKETARFNQGSVAEGWAENANQKGHIGQRGERLTFKSARFSPRLFAKGSAKRVNHGHLSRGELLH
jgi:hypothetical protein